MNTFLRQIRQLAHDSPSAVWHLMPHVFDITLRNVSAFDVCLNAIWVSNYRHCCVA